MHRLLPVHPITSITRLVIIFLAVLTSLPDFLLSKDHRWILPVYLKICMKCHWLVSTTVSVLCSVMSFCQLYYDQLLMFSWRHFLSFFFLFLICCFSVEILLHSSFLVWRRNHSEENRPDPQLLSTLMFSHAERDNLLLLVYHVN